MKKYIAIGHFDDSENITSVSMKATTIKNFRDYFRKENENT